MHPRRPAPLQQLPQGFKVFHKESRIAGVILNRVGSDRHGQACRTALEETGIPVLGTIPRDPALELESRHLGLVSTLDRDALYAKISRVAQTMSQHLDIDRIAQIAHGAAPYQTWQGRHTRSPRPR